MFLLGYRTVFDEKGGFGGGSINCLIDISERLPFTVTRIHIGTIRFELILEVFK